MCAVRHQEQGKGAKQRNQAIGGRTGAGASAGATTGNDDWKGLQRNLRDCGAGVVKALLGVGWKRLGRVKYNRSRRSCQFNQSRKVKRVRGVKIAAPFSPVASGSN
jgi:hypothetical protein